MSKKHKYNRSLLGLPFISILDDRPKNEQFIMLAYDIGGYCGYESTFWDKDDEHCKHAVAWLALPNTHVYTRKCAIFLKKANKDKKPLLSWSTHFSVVRDNEYVSLEKLPKEAHLIKENINVERTNEYLDYGGEEFYPGCDI